MRWRAAAFLLAMIPVPCIWLHWWKNRPSVSGVRGIMKEFIRSDHTPWSWNHRFPAGPAASTHRTARKEHMPVLNRLQWRMCLKQLREWWSKNQETRIKKQEKDHRGPQTDDRKRKCNSKWQNPNANWNPNDPMSKDILLLAFVLWHYFVIWILNFVIKFLIALGLCPGAQIQEGLSLLK